MANSRIMITTEIEEEINRRVSEQFARINDVIQEQVAKQVAIQIEEIVRKQEGKALMDDTGNHDNPAEYQAPFKSNIRNLKRTHTQLLQENKQEQMDGSSSPKPEPEEYYEEWQWVKPLLETWRQAGHPTIRPNPRTSSYITIYPVESESPEHAIPVIVSKLTKEGNRIDLLEDSLQTLPDIDALEDLDDHVTEVTAQAKQLREEVDEIREWAYVKDEVVEVVDQKFKNLEKDMKFVKRTLRKVVRRLRIPRR